MNPGTKSKQQENGKANGRFQPGLGFDHLGQIRDWKARQLKIVYKRMSIKSKLRKDRSEVSSFHYPMKN